MKQCSTDYRSRALQSGDASEVLISFAERQNSDDALAWLSIRRVLQRRIGHLLSVQLTLVVLVPALLTLTAFFVPQLRPAIACASLAVAFLDIFVLDRIMKALLADSAKSQESFDCIVFGIEWNPFIAGPPISERRRRTLKRHERSSDATTDWYPICLKHLPSDQAALAAQRANLAYDGWVRSFYAYTLLGLIVAIGATAISISWFALIDYDLLILGVLVPAVPIVNWCAREFFRQRDALKRNSNISMLAEGIWNNCLTESESAADLNRLVREIQNSSYIRRSGSPAVIQSFYWKRRDRLERKMTEFANEMVSQVSGA